MNSQSQFQRGEKEWQVRWAVSHGLEDKLERRNEKPSWVLEKEYKRHNLFDASWWSLIAGKEHRWAHALNSSQAFALNLFAPLTLDARLAGSVVRDLLHNRKLPNDTSAQVYLEYTPPGAPGWLGENPQQPTQVDVFFDIGVHGEAVGALLVEVKFTEAAFGTCRGWNGRENGAPLNPDRDRCLSTLAGMPGTGCWLAARNHRTYWRWMIRSDSSFRLNHLNETSCPFRGGLYQLMRNRVLADALVANTSRKWADLAICIHPRNTSPLRLDMKVEGESGSLAAFRSLTRPGSIITISPDDVLAAVTERCSYLSWAAWMRDRYRLGHGAAKDDSMPSGI